MRQRRAAPVSGSDAVPTSKSLTRRIAEVDLFSKPHEDYQRVQTKHGAALSLLTVTLICILILWEGVAYLRGRDAYDTDVSLDAGLSDEMQVNLDVFFPYLPCHRLSIDVVDATGTRKFNCSGTVHKLPTSSDGQLLYKGDLKALDVSPGQASEKDASFCQRCPAVPLDGVSDELRASAAAMCCNTCDAAKRYYAQLGKAPPDLAYIPQCLEELAQTARGCTVAGSLDLKKVPVTVVLGPRRTGNKYAYRDVAQLDTSHMIKKLRIGNESVERFSEHGVAEPLTGHRSFSKMYLETRYFVKVVPTTYQTKKSRSTRASTYEYSAQWSARPVQPILSGAVPAVVFGFEPSAIQVNNIFKRPPVTHFLVQLCGIVGGLFVILGLVDRIVEWCMLHFKR